MNNKHIKKDNKAYAKKDGESFESYCHRIASLRKEIGCTWEDIAQIVEKETGTRFSGDKYRKQESRWSDKEENFTDDNNSSDVLTINYEKNETTSTKEISLSADELQDPARLLKAHGFDPQKWDIKTAYNRKGNRINQAGIITEFYTSRIIVKPKDTNKEITVEEIKEIFKDFKPKFIPTPIPRQKNHSREFLVIPLYDFHWGRFAADINFDHFDIEEEKQKILKHINKYIAKFNNREFSGIFLVVGQDFLNSSFTGYTTSQSHLQSNILDIRTMFKSGAELLIEIIEAFRQMTPNELHIIGSLGNHDTFEEIALFQLIEAYYHNDNTVYIDSTPTPRKYLKLGNSCIGLGHLDKERDRIYGLMQVEAKDLWAETECHVWLAGHLHHFEVNNKQGVEVYRIPSICSRDQWTVDQGYTMNSPKTMCFVFDEEEGLSETHTMYL